MAIKTRIIGQAPTGGQAISSVNGLSAAQLAALQRGDNCGRVVRVVPQQAGRQTSGLGDLVMVLESML